MTKINVIVFVALICGVSWFVQADVFVEDILTGERNYLSSEKVGWDVEGSVSDELKALRVGSPRCNFAKDIKRVVAYIEGSTPGIESNARELFRVESWVNVKPNTLFGFTFDGRLVILEFENAHPNTFKEYMVSQGKGILELPVQITLDLGLAAFGQCLLQPFTEVGTAVISSEPLHVRWTNDAKSLGESVTSFYHTAYDLGDKASQGDIMRSLKAIARLPINVVDLTLKTANKTIALPFDLIRTSIDGLLKKDLSAQEEVKQTIIENSDYDVEMNIANEYFSGFWSAYDGSLTLKGAENTLPVRISNLNAKWNVEIWNTVNWNGSKVEKARFIARIDNLKQNYIASGSYLLVGEVDGTIDVEIRGYVLPLDEGIKIVGRNLPYNVYINALEKRNIGRFYFND